ncbi:MAG: hypothetical protein ABFS86_21050 [Planctomycetota bacterium]
MKTTVTTFLLGALLGAAIALGVRAAILSADDGGHATHEGGQPVAAEHAGHESGMAMPEPAAEPEPTGFLIDLGNEKCPIMGGKVNGKTYSEWNGLRIGHCCPPCIEDLLAAPEKSLDDAGIEWREAAKLVAAVRASEGGEREALLAKAEEKYGIVRMPEGSE